MRVILTGSLAVRRGVGHLLLALIHRVDVESYWGDNVMFLTSVSDLMGTECRTRDVMKQSLAPRFRTFAQFLLCVCVSVLTGSLAVRSRRRTPCASSVPQSGSYELGATTRVGLNAVYTQFTGEPVDLFVQ